MTKTNYEFDLRPFTKSSDSLSCDVLLLGEGEQIPWITCGEVTLRKAATYSSLEAFLKGHTDGEHDSAYAFSIQLIGVSYQGTYSHGSVFEAYIDPTSPLNFHMPIKGQDLFEGSTPCEDCSGDDAHRISAKYIPSANLDLWKSVRGMRVEIYIGPHR